MDFGLFIRSPPIEIYEASAKHVVLDRQHDTLPSFG
jgi:hypothetical protein